MTATRRAVLAGGAVVAAGALLRGGAAAPTGVRLAAVNGQQIVLPSGRTYWLCGAVGGATARPLVVALHGSGLTADNINTVGWSLTGGWASHAETHGYTLALGEGAERSWNPGGAWTLHHGQDDIAYLAEMATDVASRTPIEPARRFIAGFSAGAAMAWTATVRRPDLFAACASSSGWAAEYPPIGQPIDCWHCHGTADVTIPIRGGAGALGIDYPAASLEATRAPRGSRVVMYAASWGHAMPGWFAGAAWDFFTRDRLLP